uniref:NR LBD domain-containing protein n=1 Tax=Anabas testudineus TaxID=64144 RepID=A0A3Q1I1S8_ANATE
IRETCRSNHRYPHTILYKILSWRDRDHLNSKLNCTASEQSCHCEQRRTVCLKDPKATYQVASSVLVKTICFMRSLPSFSQLRTGDQLLLLRHCWAPLFVLGLAQEKIVILRQILLGPGLTEKDAAQPTLDEVHRLKTCLHHLWNLDLSPKEYAYLKGAVLFNPAVQGLSALSFIEGLQQEAQRALHEVTHLRHPGDASRFSHILLAASSTQTVSHHLTTELFFKPVISNIDMLHLLTEMLFVQ